MWCLLFLLQLLVKLSQWYLSNQNHIILGHQPLNCSNNNKPTNYWGLLRPFARCFCLNAWICSVLRTCWSLLELGLCVPDVFAVDFPCWKGILTTSSTFFGCKYSQVCTMQIMYTSTLPVFILMEDGRCKPLE